MDPCNMNGTSLATQAFTASELLITSLEHPHFPIHLPTRLKTLMLLNFCDQMLLILSSLDNKIFCTGYIDFDYVPKQYRIFFVFFENPVIALHFRSKIQKLIFRMEFFRAIQESSLYRDYLYSDKKSLINIKGNLGFRRNQ